MTHYAHKTSWSSSHGSRYAAKCPEQAKGEKTADSEDKGGKAGPAMPITNTSQLPTPFQDPQSQQGGSHLTSYGIPSQKQGLTPPTVLGISYSIGGENRSSSHQ